MNKLKKEILKKEIKYLNESLILATEKINRKRASVKREKTAKKNLIKRMRRENGTVKHI
jgi:hypothetical protein